MQLKTFLDALFARAKQEGIERCEAYISESDSFEASVNNGEIIDYNVAGSMGLSFRALIDGKMGYASTQVLDGAAIDLLINGAIANAQLIESNDEQFIYAGDSEYPALEGHDPTLDSVSVDEKIDMVKRLERLTMDCDDRIAQTDQCLIMSGNERIQIVNSLGLNLSHKSNMLCAASMPIAKANDRVNSGMGYQIVRDPKKLSLEAVAREAADDALKGLSAAPVSSGSYTIALSNLAATSLLSVFVGVFSAEMAQKGMSLLKGKENELIAAEGVTLMDDPIHPDGFAGAPFDAEGVCAYAKPIIDQGRLTTLLHNLKTARKQNLARSTANAAKGSYQSSIGIAPSNFYFKPGELSFDELIAGIGEGLLITDLQGLHAGANPISGDFSLSAKGFVIAGGELGGAVDQITVTGNFYQLLKDIEAVANDLRFSFPGAMHCGSPALRVKSLFVAGM